MSETLVDRLPEIIDIGSQRQLFLDDHLIAFMEHVARFLGIEVSQ